MLTPVPSGAHCALFFASVQTPTQVNPAFWIDQFAHEFEDARGRLLTLKL